jgi:hypothetical protein
MQHRDMRFVRFLARSGVLAIAATLGAAGLVPVAANSQQPQQAQPMPPRSADSISEQKLDAVAAALKQVTDIRDSYQQKIEESPPGERKRLADEANSALTRAINDQGLSVEEYSSIIVVAQNDPGVREKLLQRIQPPAK